MSKLANNALVWMPRPIGLAATQLRRYENKMRYLLIILLLLIKPAIAETMMFTCDITSIDLKAFFIDTKSHAISYPEIFSDALGPEDSNKKFILKQINDEYLHLYRSYEGKKHRTEGTIEESVYILRYTSHIDNRKVIRAKSKIIINGKYITGNTGTCIVASKLF